MSVNSISQGPSYGNADIPNSTSIDINALQSLTGTSPSYKNFNNRGFRLANHSGWRNPSTGAYQSGRPSDLGSCRGNSHWGYRQYVQSSYEYQNVYNNTGVGIGLYSQTSSQMQFVFVSTDNPTTQSHYTNSYQSTVSNWTPIVSSPTISYNYPQRPSCYVYAKCGPTSTSQDPLYVHFNGTNTPFSMAVVVVQLGFFTTDVGIHEWVVTSTTSQQAAGNYANPPSTITTPGTTYGVNWTWAAIYFAATQTWGSKPYGVNHSLSGYTDANSTLYAYSNSPIGKYISFSMDNSNSTVPTISNLVPQGHNANTFCAAGFYLGMR